MIKEKLVTRMKALEQKSRQNLIFHIIDIHMENGGDYPIQLEEETEENLQILISFYSQIEELIIGIEKQTGGLTDEEFKKCHNIITILLQLHHYQKQIFMVEEVTGLIEAVNNPAVQYILKKEIGYDFKFELEHQKEIEKKHVKIQEKRIQKELANIKQ